MEPQTGEYPSGRPALAVISLVLGDEGEFHLGLILIIVQILMKHCIGVTLSHDIGICYIPQFISSLSWWWCGPMSLAPHTALVSR